MIELAKKSSRIAIFIIISMFIVITLFFISKNSFFTNSIDKIELSEEKISNDWNLEIFFYDSNINNGKTPLTEYNWNAVDHNEIKDVIIQINYKNSNIQTSYAPGELKIIIPKLKSYNGYFSLYDITAGTIEDGFQWKYAYSGNNIVISNNSKVEANTNFEGSIQLAFRPSPIQIRNNTVQEFSAQLEYKKEIIAQSDKIIFNYTSSRKEHSINIKANKVNGYDRLPEDAENYIWIRWHVDLYSNYGVRDILVTGNNGYRPATIDSKLYFVTHVPANAIVVDSDMNVVENKNGEAKINTYTHGFYYATESLYRIQSDIIIGYPLEEYKTQKIENKIDVYGVYWDEEETSYLCNNTSTINAADYLFTGYGRLYWHTKNNGGIISSDRSKLNYSSTQYSNNIDIRYTGKAMDVEIADDLMFAPNSNNEYRQLNDDEYYFSGLDWIGGVLINSNNTKIQPYDMELWVRYSGETNFVLFKDGLIANKSYENKERFDFTTSEKKVVGWKVVLKDVEESLLSQWSYMTRIFVSVSTDDISDNGYVYNFSYLKVYIDGELQNTASLENYGTEMTQLDIGTHDIEKYGEYLSRSVGKAEIKSSIIPTSMSITSVDSGKLTNNISLEQFEGRYKVSTTINTTRSANKEFSGFSYYTLLPNGMNYKSISNMDNLSGAITELKTKSGNILSKEYIFERINIKVKENWNNTGRTLLIVTTDFSDDPLDLSTLLTPNGFGDDSYPNINFPNIYFEVAVPYDSYLEYGVAYDIEVWMKLLDTDNEDFFPVEYSDHKISLKDSEKINGNTSFDLDDLNENGKNEIMEKRKSNLLISDLIASHQDVTTYVQTSNNNYTTNDTTTELDSNYEYKYRVRTGTTSITNLVLYTNLESAQDYREHWKGEIVSIDTNYAESKGYNVKIYYSEEINTSSLRDDTSWKEYNENTDKTKIKSLAFEYLLEDGSKAIIPENSLTYVIVKMHAPSDEKIQTIAYNNCWTEWNAIDTITDKPVDFITGIISNTTKVSLPNTKQTEDINIAIEKHWQDNNNELGLRPKQVKIKLIINDNYNSPKEIIISTINSDLSNKNLWKKNIDLPKYDSSGTEIKYNIFEEIIEINDNYKYIPEVDEFTITNTLSKNTIIRKKWLDNNNYYSTRPEKISINILQNSEFYKDIILTGNYTEDWIKQISLPVYDSEGNKNVYTLEEIEVENYNCVYNEENYTFTNTLVGEEKIIINKKWIDNSNEYNTRPEKITVDIIQNNNYYQSIVLQGESDNWVSDSITVPKYDTNGVKYDYKIKEKIILEEYGLIEYNQKSYTIYNTLKQNINITVKKKWLDDSNSYNTRPTELNITLLQNGKYYKTISLNGDTDIWEESVNVPKYDSNQKKYNYMIKEINEGIINEYSDITYSEDGLEVTNKLKKDTDLKITKIWKDNNNEYLTRPTKIKITLLQNDREYKQLELSGTDNQWVQTIENVPVYDDKGVKYKYTIKEIENESMPKYQKVQYDQTTLTVTNELTEIPKVTLYFTVTNGYTNIGDNEVKFDEEGLKNVMKQHNINSDGEYYYTFELQNISTGHIYEGKLSTQGILQFQDIPYGTYKAIEADDEYFDFVSMLSIAELPGVTFTAGTNGGTITIVPTGEDITYGLNVVNKINNKVANPPTVNSRYNFLLIIVLVIISGYLFYKKTQNIIYINK